MTKSSFLISLILSFALHVVLLSTNADWLKVFLFPPQEVESLSDKYVILESLEARNISDFRLPDVATESNEAPSSIESQRVKDEVKPAEEIAQPTPKESLPPPPEKTPKKNKVFNNPDSNLKNQDTNSKVSKLSDTKLTQEQKDILAEQLNKESLKSDTPQLDFKQDSRVNEQENFNEEKAAQDLNVESKKRNTEIAKSNSGTSLDVNSQNGQSPPLNSSPSQFDSNSQSQKPPTIPKNNSSESLEGAEKLLTEKPNEGAISELGERQAQPAIELIEDSDLTQSAVVNEGANINKDDHSETVQSQTNQNEVDKNSVELLSSRLLSRQSLNGVDIFKQEQGLDNSNKETENPEDYMPNELSGYLRGLKPERTNQNAINFTLSDYGWSFEHYAEQWANALRKWWRVPADYRAGKVPNGGSVWISVRIKSNGELLDFKVYKSGVTTEMENKVIQALVSSFHRPPLPKDFKKEHLVVNWQFIYPQINQMRPINR